ncbi:hypothetical protein HBB16_13235 [Pseudonocardia sp. MCCB 268]|nr:hypothetical protein [Pseudonocardia cytotoxica]
MSCYPATYASLMADPRTWLRREAVCDTGPAAHRADPARFDHGPGRRRPHSTSGRPLPCGPAGVGIELRGGSGRGSARDSHLRGGQETLVGPEPAQILRVVGVLARGWTAPAGVDTSPGRARGCCSDSRPARSPPRCSQGKGTTARNVASWLGGAKTPPAPRRGRTDQPPERRAVAAARGRPRRRRRGRP